MAEFSKLEIEGEGGNKDADTREDWQDIFDLLDPKDGESDGFIDKLAFLEWIDTLSFQETISLEAKNGISRHQLRHLIESADADDNNLIDKGEFLSLIQKHSGALERVQKSALLRYLRVAAYAEEYRWWPPPVFTLVTILATVSIYLYHVATFLQQGLAISWSGPVPLCSLLIFNSDLRHQAWRYFSYSLVHAGVEHILVNMCLMVLVGIPLEMSNSWWRVGLVYSLGVVAGALCSSLTSPGTFLAGASGGVYALASAHIAALLLNWKEDSLILRQRIRNKKLAAPTFGKVVRLARVLVVAGILGVDLVSSLLLPAATTSYVAHLAGAGCGLLLGLVVLKNRRVQHWEVWLRAACCCLAAALILLGAVLNVVLVHTISDLEHLQHCAFYIP